MHYLVALILIAYIAFMIYLKVYGAILGFKKKWYIGLAFLFIPWFAEIVAFTHIFLKKDLLK